MRKKRKGVMGKESLYVWIKPTTKKWLVREAKKSDTSVGKLIDSYVGELKAARREVPISE